MLAPRVERDSRSFEALCDVGQRHGKGLHCRERVLEVERISVAVDTTELHHLFSLALNLEVFGRLLGDAAAEIELVHLAMLVP